MNTVPVHIKLLNIPTYLTCAISASCSTPLQMDGRQQQISRMNQKPSWFMLTEWNLKPIHVVLMHSPLKQKAVSPTTNPAIHWHLLACLLGLLRKATFARSTFEIDVSFSCLSHRLSSNKLNNFSNREGLGVPEYKKSPQAGTLRNESKHFWGAVGTSDVRESSFSRLIKCLLFEQQLLSDVWTDHERTCLGLDKATTGI